MDNILPELYPSRIRNFLQHCLYYVPYNMSQFVDYEMVKSNTYKNIFDLIDCYVGDKKELLGTKSKNEYTESIIKQFMKPRLFDLVRYDSKDFYTNIYCPIYVTYGEKDKMMDYQTQMYSLERLFFSSGKKTRW